MMALAPEEQTDIPIYDVPTLLQRKTVAREWIEHWQFLCKRLSIVSTGSYPALLGSHIPRCTELLGQSHCLKMMLLS